MIQRDVDPVKDKILNKMLDAKFSKRGAITTGATLRKMKSLIKSLEIVKAALEKQEKEDENEDE